MIQSLVLSSRPETGSFSLEDLNSVQLTMKLCLFLLLQSVVVAKTWIECEYNAKALNLSMRFSRKHEVVAEA